MKPGLSGLIPAVHTPFRRDGQLDLPVVAAQRALFQESGVSGVFVCGTTGEGHSLTLDERRRLAECWVDEAGGKLPVIVHVGHNCQADAVELAAHAQAIGADAVSALAPSYFKPPTVEDLTAFFEPVAAAAPDLPFYYYDIPGMTGLALPTEVFLREARTRIRTLAGLKYSSPDMMRLQACLEGQGWAFTVLYGSDQVLLAALALGVHGAVGSTYNVATSPYRQMMAAFEAGDWTEARRRQYESVRLVEVLIRFGVIRATKALMGMMGVPCGPVRTPLAPLDPDAEQALYREVEAMNVCVRPLRAPGNRG